MTAVDLAMHPKREFIRIINLIRLSYQREHSYAANCSSYDL